MFVDRDSLVRDNDDVGHNAFIDCIGQHED